MREYILLISCPDQLGLIHKITSILFDCNFNIISNKEFVDIEDKMFFMRTHVKGDGVKNNILKKIKDLNLKEETLVWKEVKTPSIVLMGSDEYHCIADILSKNMYEDLNAKVLSLISQKDSLKTLSKKFDIPFHFISKQNLSRQEHEEKILKTLEKYSFDYIITAKYMRIFTENFTSKFKNKIINIHHSFLPSFKGYNPYEEAFKRGVKIIGATAHFVNQDLDEGPIIAQEILPVSQDWSVSDMKRQGRAAEVNALSKALDLVFSDRVIVYKNKTIIL